MPISLQKRKKDDDDKARRTRQNAVYLARGARSVADNARGSATKASGKSTNSSTTSRNSSYGSQRASQGTSTSPSSTNKLFEATKRKYSGSSYSRYGDSSARGDGRGVKTSATTTLRDRQGINLKTRKDVEDYDKKYADKARENKIDQTVRGSARQFVGGHLASAGTTAQELETTARSYNKAKVESDSGKNYSLRSREEAEKRRQEAEKNFGVKEGIRLKEAERNYNDYDPNGFSQKLIRKGDQLIEQGSKDIEEAKKGLGVVGRTTVDLGANALQMMGDRMLAFVPGVGQALAMGSLMNRAGGTASYEARQEGMNPDQQFMYQQGTALIEGLSEGIFNSVSAFQSTYGRGAFSLAEKVTTRAAAGNIVQNFLKNTATGKAIFTNLARLGAQGMEEGIEEIVADLAEPALKYALIKSSDPSAKFEGYNAKDIAYDFMIGALMGGIPGSVEAMNGISTDIGMSQAMADGKLSVDNLINQGLVQGREGANTTNAEILARQMQTMQEQDKEIQPIQVRMLQDALGQSTEMNANAFERKGVEERQKATEEGRLKTNTGTATEESAYQRGTKAVEEKNTERAKTAMGEDASETSTSALGRVLSGSADIDDHTTILADSKAREAVEELTGEKLSVNNAKARNQLETLTLANEIANEDSIRKEVQTAHAEDIAKELTSMSNRGGEIFKENYDEAVKVIGSGTEYLDVFTRLYTDGTVKESNFDEAYNRIVLQRGGAVAEFFTEPMARKAFNAGRVAIVAEEGKAIAKSKANKSAETGSGISFEGNAKNKISKRQADLLGKFAERANVHIRIVETISTEDGGGANGMYKDGIIYIAADSDNKLITVAKHELTHHIRQTAPERYQELEDFVFQKWYDSDADAMENKVARYQRLYDCTAEEAREEIIADASEAFFTDEAAIQEALSFSEKLGKAIHDGIHTLLDNFLDIQDTDSIRDKGYGEFLKDIDILKEAEQKWLKALDESANREKGAETPSADDYTDADAFDPTDYKFSLVEDKDEIRRLNAEPSQKTYRSMVLAFRSNQIKNADNLNPTSSDDIRYSRKQDQYDILQNANPMLDTYHTGIRSAKDIKNASEVFARKDFSGTPDWTYEDAQKALKNGKITVFSSKPIVNGTFVTPSMMEAESYAGEGNFYQAEVPIEDVAWIDSVEGQYAKVSNEAIQSEPKFSIKLMNYAAAKPVMDEGGKVVGARVFRDKNGDPLLMSGLEVTSETMKLMGKESKIPFVKRFLEKQARFMEKMGEKYTFIGLKDVSNADLEVRRDKNGNPVSIVVSAMVKNGEYPVNFDFSSICKKRQALSKLFEKLSTGENGEFLDSVELSVENLWKINEILSENGFETACLGCFVETKRYGIENWADTFAEKWNKAVLEKNPNAEYFNFASSKDIDFGYVSDEMDRFAENKKDEREKESKRRKKERESFIKKWLKKNPDESEANAEKAYKEWWKKAYNLKADQYKESWFESPALSNDKAIAALVNSGDKMQKLIRKTDLISPKGLKALMALHPDFYGVLYGHFGSGTPKPMVSFTPYNSEIALLGRQVNPNGGMKRYTPEANATLVNKLVEIGGVRIQSFSDFLIQNTFDYMQMVADMAARNFPAHAYTKEIAFAKIFGLTGIKINLSVMFDVDPDGIAPGLDKDGNYVVADKSRQEREKKNGNHVFAFSISYDEAVELQNSEGYDGNVGIIGVGLSDLHIRKMLNDPDIKMVIPYHSSGMPAVIKQLTKLGADSDYTSTQNTLDISKIERDGVDVTKQYGKDYMLNLYKEKGSWKEAFAQFRKDTEGCTITPVKAFASTGNFPLYTGDPVMSLDATNDPKRTAEYYMGWCIENGHFPLFYQFADEENYYKVLYDFNVYHNDGTYAPQNAVENEYPEDLESVIEQYMKEANDFEQAQMPKWDNVINETKEMLKSNSYKEENGKLSRKEPNYGYHAGDLGKSIGDSYYSQSFDRGTGHFGFGTYFVGDKAILKGTGIGDRPVETVDFDKYNLFRPRNYRNGIELHEALKVLDGYAKRYSDLSRLTDWDNWKERSYLTGGILNDLDEYIWQMDERENPSKELKAKIDKYIEGMPEHYRYELEKKVNSRYEEAQKRSTDKELVKEALGREFDRLYGDRGRSYLYDSKEAYVEGKLDDEIRYINENKARSLEDWKYLEAESVIKDYTKELTEDIDNVRDIDFKLWMALGGSKESIQNALKKTEEIIKAYPEVTKGLDSAATVFMKQLGYEGVDVRGIEGLDNTKYGSVIYDLKDEDLARKKEIGTAKYSRKESNSTSTPTTQNTIAKLEEQVADLKAEFKRTNLKTANQKDVRIQAGRLIQRHGSNMQAQTSLMDTFNKIFGLYKDKGEKAFDEVYEIAKDEAVNIVNNIGVIHNEGAEEYKAIKQYLRETPIQIDEAMKRNITDYNDFRKKNFGRLKLVNGETSNIDNVYMELSELFPAQFTEDYVNPHDQLNHIIDVLDNYAPFYESLDGASEEMQDYVVDIAADIMETAYNLQTKKTFADKKYEEKVKAVAKAREEALASRNRALDRQRERYEKKLDTLKEKHQDFKADTRENAEKKRRIKQISNVYKRLLEKLQTNNDAKHLPDGYAPVVSNVLKMFDFTTPGMEKWAERHGEPSKRYKYMLELRKQLDEMSKTDAGVEVDPDLLDLVDELMADIGENQKLTDLDSRTLEDIATLFRAFEHQVNSYNKAFDEANKKTVSDTAHSIFDHLDETKKSKWKLGIMGRFLTSNFNPSDFFELVGGDIANLYNATRLGFDKYVDRLDNAKTFLQDMVDNKKADKWANHLNTFKTSAGEEIKLTDTQLMSLYCLNKREQAQGHIYVGGIVSAPLKVRSKNKITTKELEKTRVIPTVEDIGKWFDTLTDEQKRIADSIQRYFVDEVSEWGNETSMKLYNYKKFGEENYFPIQSSSDYMASNFDQRGDDPVLKNMGMTKALTKNASNAIVVDDIFTVFSKHIAQMASYNAYVPAITDFQRVWNYTEGNDQDMVKARFERVYGKQAAKYIDNFFKNLNGVYKANFDPTILDKGLGLFKKAAVGGNIRVLVQQPTAIARASLIINPAYLTAAVPLATAQPKKTYKEMMDHCPIARWKTWGFYSSDITSASRDLRNIMIGKDALTDKIFMNMYGTADNVTWTVIFKACELQVSAQNKGLKKGSDEYWEKVNELASRVFDRTQVVDSPFHRSEIMKSQNGITKMATAFMAEPTKTINMINTELTKAAIELKNGHPARATGVFVRVGAVITANAAALALAQAMVDAMRHAGGDDDKDKGDYKERFKNYWKSNFTDNLNPLGMIPYLKDAWSLWQGYDVTRMDMNGVQKVVQSIQYLQKYYEDPSASKYSAQEEWTNLALSTMYAVGVPISNAKRDIEGLYVSIMEGMGHPEVFFHQAKRKYQLNDKTRGSFVDMYYDALQRGDRTTANEIHTWLVKGGITEEYIKKRKKTWEKHQSSDEE